MSLQGRNVVVIGAGIGGLAAALCLRARGAEVTVLEQASEINEVGAGLQITPNGAVVLRALGLECALAAGAVRARGVVLRDYRDGTVVMELDLDRLAAGQSYYFVHRADLIDLLSCAAREAGVRIRLLQKVDHVDPGRQPELTVASQARIQADLIVGADGLHSRARTALNGADAPFFTRQVAWRAVVPNSLGLPDQAQLIMGPGRHLVCYPLRGGNLVNIVAVQERAAWAAEGWAHRDDPANLRAAFGDFGGQAGQLLAQVDDVGLWGLFRHPVAPVWQRDGVVLLGDAAHPTLPFLAQGANMALEDAWTLADSLARATTQAEGLAAYATRRRPRVSKVIKAASRNAWKYHLRATPLRAAAQLVLKTGGALAPGLAVRSFDWIYGYDVTA